MYFGLLLLWIIFSGKVTLEVVGVGAIVCGWLYWFMYKFLGYKKEVERKILSRLPLVIWYFITLICAIIKANLLVMKMILSPKLEMEPKLITFHSPLKTDLAQVVLANSITLTPGTYTVRLSKDTYYVHALDASFAKGIENSVFVKQLKKLEE